MKAAKLLATFIFIISAFYTVVNFASPSKKHPAKENHPPVVKIINPKAGSFFDWNTQVNYAITVSDKEDGDSKFDEINDKEVLLEVRYAADTSKLPGLGRTGKTSAGLTLMRTSNCFNCHNFTGKLIGPSLYDIGKHYTATQSNIALLAKRIKEGADGVWGKVTMPKHPELAKAETQAIVEWILKNAADPGMQYYIGAESFFKTGPPLMQQKGYYILTASYIDHGLKEDTTVQHLMGQDVIVISSK